MKLKLQLGVEVVVKVRVPLLVRAGGWVGGCRGESEKTQINAILNSVGVKVEVGVELGKIICLKNIVILSNMPCYTLY